MEKEKKRGKRRGLLLCVLLLLLVAAALALAARNPRVRMLRATMYFAEHTLKDPSYLACNLDMMDLFCNYMNGDVTYSGRAHMHSVEGLGFSSAMDVEGARSFAHKEMTMHADMDVLWFNVGEMDLYAREETMYMVVPMLDGLSQAFVTGENLFPKAPELTSDLDREWFHDNMGNIVALMQQIDISETGRTINDDGKISREYRIVIPQGSGGFLWELLGMEAPDHDIVVDVFLTPQSRLRHVEVDLSRSVEGLSLVVDGEKADRCIITRELPDDERATLTVARDGEITYTNLFSLTADYETNTGDVYQARLSMELEPEENGAKMKISDMIVTKNDETTLAEGSFDGTLVKTSDLPDLFADVGVDLDAIEKVTWEEIRRDTEGFVRDMVQKARDSLP